MSFRQNALRDFLVKKYRYQVLTRELELYAKTHARSQTVSDDG
jgi:hypothetical protein